MPRTRLLVTALALLALLSGTGLADKVDDLSRKLRSDPDYKVRLSAALNLGKLRDPRGIGALVDALDDSDRTVRGVAAAALGPMVDKRVAPELIERARTGLDHTAHHDRDASVRKQAARSLAELQRLGPASAGAAIYVEVGPMTDSTKRAPAVPSLMRRQVLDSLARRAPMIVTRWPGGRAPSDADLKRRRTAGFYIDGALTQLTVSKAPPHVTCAVSVLLATYPQKSLFGFLKGGAEVDAASISDSSILAATADCVNAVIDDLIGTSLVPTIKARVPGGAK